MELILSLYRLMYSVGFAPPVSTQPTSSLQVHVVFDRLREDVVAGLVGVVELLELVIVVVITELESVIGHVVRGRVDIVG